jgi:hypothetical protein
MKINSFGTVGGLGLFVALAFAGGAAAQDSEDPEESGEPSTEEQLDFVRENAHELLGVQQCVSVGSDGSIIEPNWNPDTESFDPIPVGGDRWLECSTFEHNPQQTFDYTTLDESRWCMLGNLGAISISWTGPGLKAEVVRSPENDRFLVTATADTPMEVAPGRMFGGLTWPIQIMARYTIARTELVEREIACDDYYGL